jgi:hypothetical protein
MCGYCVTVADIANGPYGYKFVELKLLIMCILSTS